VGLFAPFCTVSQIAAYPPEFNRLRENDLSPIQDIGKDKQKYSIMLRHKAFFQFRILNLYLSLYIVYCIYFLNRSD